MGFMYRKFLQGTESPLEDVLRNLGYLLRAKRGAASFLPGFGLSETGFRTVEEMLVQLSEEIRENIRLYEPRIEVTDIEEDYEGEDGHPRLVVHCRLKDSSERLSLTLDPRSRTLTTPAPASPEEDA
jgi:predicted component of type VI protein secretion system